jgi:hypothetical protein
MYSIHYGLYPLHNHTSPALKRVPFTFLQPPLQPLRSSPLLRGPTAAFQAPKFASHWSRSKCQGGGAWNLAWAWRMVKKTTGLAQGKMDICKKSSFSPTKKRCFNCRFSVPKPLILDMAAMAQL